MFTAEEKALMNRLGLKYDFNNLTDDEWFDVNDTVADYLVLQCFDENYEPNADGIMCEHILDKLNAD